MGVVVMDISQVTLVMAREVRIAGPPWPATPPQHNAELENSPQ